MFRQCPHPIHHTLPIYEVHTDAEGVTIAQYHEEEMVDSVYLLGDDGMRLLHKILGVENSEDMTEVQKEIVKWNMLDAYFYEPAPEYALGIRDRAQRGALNLGDLHLLAS